MSNFQLSGSLEGIPLPDIARLLQSTRRTGRLALVMDESRGSIFFDRGDIVDSIAGQLSGPDAMRHLALFNRGFFDFEDNITFATRSLAGQPTTELIDALEARMLEARQIIELMPEEQEVPRYLGGSIPSAFEVNAAELAVAMKASPGTLGVRHIAHELQLDLTMVRYTIARFRAAGLMDIVEGLVDNWQPPGGRAGDNPVVPPPLPVAEPPPEPEADAAHSQPRYWRGRRVD